MSTALHAENFAVSHREQLELTLLREGHVVTAHATAPCRVGQSKRATFLADELLGAFYDVSYSYRFGPPGHEVVMATLISDGGAVLSDAFWFPDLADALKTRPAMVRALAQRSPAPPYEVAVTSSECLYGVRVDVPGYLPDDNYFCLAPGREKVLHFAPVEEQPLAFGGFIEAANLAGAVPIEVENA